MGFFIKAVLCFINYIVKLINFVLFLVLSSFWGNLPDFKYFLFQLLWVKYLIFVVLLFVVYFLKKRGILWKSIKTFGKFCVCLGRLILFWILVWVFIDYFISLVTVNRYSFLPGWVVYSFSGILIFTILFFLMWKKGIGFIRSSFVTFFKMFFGWLCVNLILFGVIFLLEGIQVLWPFNRIYLFSIFLIIIIYFSVKHKWFWKFAEILSKAFEGKLRLIFLGLFIVVFFNTFFSILSFYDRFNKILPFSDGYTIGWSISGKSKCYIFPGLLGVSFADVVGKDVKRLAYTKGGYIGEYVENNRRKLCFLNRNFKIIKVYSGIEPILSNNLDVINLLGRTSPDGKYFLFYGFVPEKSEKGIYVLNVKSGEYFILKDINICDYNVGNLYISWYGSEKLIFMDAKKTQLYIYDLKEKEFEKINIFKGMPSDYCKYFDRYLFSADKKYVAYDGNCRVFIEDLTSGRRENLTRKCVGEFFCLSPIMWVNNHRELIYIGRIKRDNPLGVRKSYCHCYICCYNLKSKTHYVLGSLNIGGVSPFLLKNRGLVNEITEKNKKYFILFCIIGVIWILNLLFFMFYRDKIFEIFFKGRVENLFDSFKFNLKMVFVFFSSFLLLDFFSFVVFEFHPEVEWTLDNFIMCVNFGILKRLLIVCILIIILFPFTFRFVKERELERDKNFLTYMLYLFSVIFMMMSGLNIFFMVIILFFYLLLSFWILVSKERLVVIINKKRISLRQK